MKQLLENWKRFVEEVETLEELLVHGSLNDTKGPNVNVIAHGKDLWVMRELPPSESPERERLFKQLSKALGVELDPEGPWYDTLGDVAYHTDEFEDRSDILFGDVDKDSMTLNIQGSFSTFKLDPRSSLLVKKVVDTLGIRNVTYMYGDDAEAEVHGSEVRGEMPTAAYHGTTITYLRSIFKFGLVPGKSETNYEGIVHNDAVFFSTRFDEALHHAVHTASKKGGHPVVLELRVPDKDKLIPDYDVDIGAGDTGCYDYICSKLRDKQKKYYDKEMKQKSSTLSKEFGMYGYKGRIPSSFIKSYYILMNPADNDIDVWHSSKEDFTRMNQKQASIYIDTFENYGYGYTEYPDPSVFWGDDEEDEEDEE